MHPDKVHTVRRAMHVLEGLGPQDPSSRFDHSPETNSRYDHPYFGQIFLATIFSIVGFPDSYKLRSYEREFYRNALYNSKNIDGNNCYG